MKINLQIDFNEPDYTYGNPKDNPGGYSIPVLESSNTVALYYLPLKIISGLALLGFNREV